MNFLFDDVGEWLTATNPSVAALASGSLRLIHLSQPRRATRRHVNAVLILPHVISHIIGFLGRLVVLLLEEVVLGQSAILGHGMRTDYKLGDVIVGYELDDLNTGGDISLFHCAVFTTYHFTTFLPLTI